MEPCRRCAQPLDATAVACPQCHALVYEAELDRLKQEALTLERDGRFHASQDVWRRMLPYLPPNTHQAAWIVRHIQEVAEVPDREDPAAPSPAPAWVKRLGPLAPIALMLLKGKGLFALFQLKSLLSLGLFAGFYSGTFGWAFGLGFAALILIHEMGHYIDITRRGLPADMPVFLPGLGAYVRWRAMGVPDDTRAAVSLAGPFAGALAACACALLYTSTGSPIWASLGRASAWLNALNLIPVWVLDGGQAVSVIGRDGRGAIAAVAIALWAVVGDGIFLLIAGVALWRTFTKDAGVLTNRFILLYFLGVLGFLGLLMRLLPGQGFGQ
jgi:Zn-dependent protease